MFKPAGLNQGQFCSPGDIWQCLETFSVVTPGRGQGVCAAVIYQIEARDAAEYRSRTGTAPRNGELWREYRA